MLVGSLVLAGLFFTVGMFLWCKNAIKRKESSNIHDDF